MNVEFTDDGCLGCIVQIIFLVAVVWFIKAVWNAV